MLLLYSHIQSTWTPDAGATWSANGAGLTARDPADRAILSWPAATTTAGLVSEFGAEQQLGGLALLNTTLPTTATIAVMGRRSAVAGYTYALAAAQTVASLPGGGTGVVLDFGAAVDPVVGARVIITFASAPAAGTYQIGELVTGPAVRPDIETGWESGDTDPSNTQRTRGGLPLRTTLPGWRTLTVTPTLTDHDAALGGGLKGGDDWQALRATLRADPYVLAAPLTLTPADRNRTGLYGLATKLPSIASRPGPNYQPNQLTVEEVPG